MGLHFHLQPATGVETGDQEGRGHQCWHKLVCRAFHCKEGVQCPQHHYEEDVVPQQLHSAVGAEQAAHAHQLHHCHDSAVDVWLKPEEVNRRNLGKFMELSFLVGKKWDELERQNHTPRTISRCSAYKIYTPARYYVLAEHFKTVAPAQTGNVQLISHHLVVYFAAD